MYDGKYIITGLVIFVAIFAMPFWYNVGTASVPPDPKLDTPVIQQLAEKKCVESKDYMKREHMQMLDDWRDWVVRDGTRWYTNSEGKKFDMSLQNTCMNCHSSKVRFCDQCHNYLAVNPYCWTCHIEPKENE